MDPGIIPTDEVIAFGSFRLFPARQLLLDDDRPVHIGSRALEILILLVRRAGEVVGKDELFARVWPDTFVEEGNLRVHITALRRALGDGVAGKRYIANVPGRGYSFVAPVAVGHHAAPAKADAAPRPGPHKLANVVGRAEEMPALSADLLGSRLISIVGPGGIGKTTMAIAVAEGLREHFADGVAFVDLAAVNDPLLVPSSLAAQLGVGVRSEDPLPGLIGFLKDKQILIVLDSCEQVIDAAASLAERLVGGTSGTHVLATGREALRAEGERIHRLSALAYPVGSDALTAADAMSYSAVQLFVERATAALGTFTLSDGDAPLLADICRRLDGLPLAIEIAASWVPAFGVPELAARLRDRFQLLMRGRRTALPRHQTLSATLDWSHAQLSELERQVLRRLSILVGMFTLESGVAVLVEGTGIDEPDAIDAIANLVGKSLVSVRLDRPTAFYRLSDVTRAYAVAKLEETGEKERLSQLHAAHFLAVLQKAQREWETRPATPWLERHRHLVDNMRAALDWSFSPAGDPAQGIAITLAAIPLWFSLSLVSECAERVDRALALLADSPDLDTAMRLNAARAWSLMQTRGLVPQTRATWQAVLDLATQRGDVDYQLRALWGLWAGLQNESELKPALALAERFCELAANSSNPMDVHVGDRMVGYILHLMGEQARARTYLERMVERYEVPVIGARMIRFVFDQRATARCFLARILWLQGHADRAARLATSLVEEASASRDVLSLCQVLVQAACPVAFFLGDLEAAERHVRTLLDQSERQALEFWKAYGRCFEAVLEVRRGRPGRGLDTLGRAIDELGGIQFGVLYGLFLSEQAAALGQAGRYAEGQAVIEEALARSRQNHELWYLPELLRIRGELALQGSLQSAQEAERCFRESLDWAKRQLAPAWALRSATSLARLLQARGSPAEARALLAPVHAGFTEGLESADVKAARTLLQELA